MKKLFILALSVCVLSWDVVAQEVAPVAEGEAVAQNIDTTATTVKAKKAKKKKNVKYNEKGEIIKTGLNFGPLPAIAFDADKGFQLGAILNIYGFGDGSYYPTPKWKTYLEASWFTKGSMLFQAQFDAKHLIPGVRLTAGVTYNRDDAFDFYGFNGYRSYYNEIPFLADYEYNPLINPNWQEGMSKADIKKINKEIKEKAKVYSPFYRMKRYYLTAKADFTGRIGSSPVYWQAGYHFQWYDLGNVNLDKINENRNKKHNLDPYPKDDLPTLYNLYNQWGIIPDQDMKGGFSSAIRAGFQVDTRDQEGTPQKGFWADAHVIVAPKFLGTTSPYYRYSLTFRHYVTCVPDVLTFAYRLNYQGSFTNHCPFYVLPLITNMGGDFDKEGLGGYRTTRGLLRTRVFGLDMALYNVEFRWVFVRFKLWNQNMAFGLSAFADGCYVVRGIDMSFKGEEQYRVSYDKYMAAAAAGGFANKDGLHASFGGGLRFIMNRNFIVAFEYGKTINKQDGFGGFYINLGYLF